MRSKKYWFFLLLIVVIACIQPLFVHADQQKGKIQITKGMISKIENQIHTGKRLQPKPVVTEHGYRLKWKKDYLLSYQHNINSGTAGITIKGIDRYKGKVIKSFQIVSMQKASTMPEPKTSNTPMPIKKEDKSMIDMKISNKNFNIVLEDNNTANALVDQLPLTLQMSELNGNEKYNFLSKSLHHDKEECPDLIHAGDVMLYGDNCLVLFYKTFHTSYNYVKIGHISDTEGLIDAVGAGNIQISFSPKAK